MEKLLRIETSDNKDKKYDAIFREAGKVSFGAKGMSDFTKHKDPERKKLYLARHKKTEDWSNPITPGALSRWILWNKPTLKASIEDYKNRFNL